MPGAFLTETSLQAIIKCLQNWATGDFQSFIHQPDERTLRAKFFSLIWGFLVAQEGDLCWCVGDDKTSGPLAKLQASSTHYAPGKVHCFTTATDVTQFLFGKILPYLGEKHKVVATTCDEILVALKTPVKRTRTSTSLSTSPSNSMTATSKKKRKTLKPANEKAPPPTQKSTSASLKTNSKKTKNSEKVGRGKKSADTKTGESKKNPSNESGGGFRCMEKLVQLVTLLTDKHITKVQFDQLKKKIFEECGVTTTIEE